MMVVRIMLFLLFLIPSWAGAVELHFGRFEASPSGPVARVGQELTYHISIQNFDSDSETATIDRTSFNIRFSSPVELTYSTTRSGGTCVLTSSSTMVWCTRAVVSPFVRFNNINIVIRPLSAGDLSATAVISPAASVGDTDRTNNRMTIHTTVTGSSSSGSSSGSRTAPTTTSSEGTGAGIFTQPSGACYNLLQSPQFQVSVIPPSGGGSSWSLANGSLGDGNGHFAGTSDERDSYSVLMGHAPNYADANSITGSNVGTYQLVRLTDHWRTDANACGTTSPDHQTWILGLPQFAMNSYPVGKRGLYGNVSYETYEGDSVVLDFRRREWTRRNYYTDFDFRFGRYLLKKNLDSEVNNYLTINRGEYQPSTNNFFDCPYSPRHLMNGFTCAEIVKANGYRSNPRLALQNSGVSGPMDEERKIFYKTLLTQAKDRLAWEIAQHHFMTVDTPTSVADRELAEMVNNAYDILNDMVPRLEGANCSGITNCLIQRIGEGAGNVIPMELGAAGSGVLVRFDGSARPNKIILRTDVGKDCLSKRGVNANLFFNVQDCTPYTAAANGLYENFIPVGTSMGAGFQLYANQGTNHFIRALNGSFTPSVDGYACQIVGLIAHQLGHGYYQRTLGKNRMSSWPSPEALYEEEEVNVIEALVVDELTALNYCPREFGTSPGMQSEDFIRDVHRITPSDINSPVYSVVNGKRFYYPEEPKGYQGIFLGPYYANMHNIAATLRSRDAESARMMALYQSMCPLMDPPPQMNISGTVSAFSLPEPARGIPPGVTNTDVQHIQTMDIHAIPTDSSNASRMSDAPVSLPSGTGGKR